MCVVCVCYQVYEEAGSDFHQVAYFRTRIGLRNALQEEISGSSDKEAVLITLNRPIVFAQPVAFDRGTRPLKPVHEHRSCSFMGSTDEYEQQAGVTTILNLNIRRDDLS